MSRRIVAWSLLLPLLAAPAWAEGEEAPARVSVRLDLEAWRLPAAARGALLQAPSDLKETGGEGVPWHDLEGRFETGPGDRLVEWVHFDAGAEEAQLDAGMVTEVLQSLAGLAREEVDLGADGARLRVSATREVVERVRARLAWAESVLLPRLEVQGVLVGGADAAVVAAGRARLLPGRWARVWLQEALPVFPVDWDIEIAQEVTAVRPALVTLAEGQELYLRWLPGEGMDLLEVWHGDLEHQEEVAIDFTPLRNVPESSGLGPVRVPRTALRRAYTTLRLPPEGAATLSWRALEGERRLSLRRVAGPPVPTSQAQEDFRVGVLRIGALGAALLFEGRDDRTAEVHDELYAAAAPDGEVELRDLASSGRTLTVVGAKAPVEAAMRKHLVAAEAALVDARLSVRTLQVPEESVRQALANGGLAVGQAPDATLLATLLRSGAPAGPAVELPLLAGVTSGFRLGASVPGLVRLDVEVAQQAGGMDPVMGARFAGLQGEARWRPVGRAAVLRLEATWAWADPQGGRADLTFRAPVGMDFNKDRVQAEPDAVRRVTLPTLTGGSADIDVDLAFEADEERLAGVVVRDGEVVLLLARLPR